MSIPKRCMLSKEFVYRQARPVIGFDISERSFRGNFGMDVIDIILLYDEIRRATTLRRIRLPNLWTFRHLLQCLNFMKVMGRNWSAITGKWRVSWRTFRKRMYQTLVILDFVLEKINFGDRNDQWSIKDPSCILDTFTCPIQKPSRRAVQYRARPKFPFGLKYEVCSSIGNPKIVWLKGPFKGSAADMRIVSDSGLRETLSDAGEQAVADAGYVLPAGKEEDEIIRPISKKKFKLTEHDRLYNYFVYSGRSAVERLIRRIRVFDCLNQAWRLGVFLHGKITNIIG
eukprot:CAMPEP_0119134116 /NCGR_PEP_ID=MMETSP1310-20130426/15631_1 /TAXON_ID=464262 /ORGANISM="Genus nov. species nov., Strain RCC2339" /LENGTH=284 /DNA_ID=CAMNT_0007124869 /DNA_START=53 /DNA_END=904 /DNA_ORIENTATION=-